MLLCEVQLRNTRDTTVDSTTLRLYSHTALISYEQNSVQRLHLCKYKMK